MSGEAGPQGRAAIELFIDYANWARTKDVSLPAAFFPAALVADRALGAFSEGVDHVRFDGLAGWAVLAGGLIIKNIRDGHWHLRRCQDCDRWLLAFDARKKNCARDECRHKRNQRDQETRRDALDAMSGRQRKRRRQHPKSNN